MKAFKEKVWLSSPTMHGDEIEYIKEGKTVSAIPCLRW